MHIMRSQLLQRRRIPDIRKQRRQARFRLGEGRGTFPTVTQPIAEAILPSTPLGRIKGLRRPARLVSLKKRSAFAIPQGWRCCKICNGTIAKRCERRPVVPGNKPLIKSCVDLLRRRKVRAAKGLRYPLT